MSTRAPYREANIAEDIVIPSPAFDAFDLMRRAKNKLIGLSRAWLHLSYHERGRNVWFGPGAQVHRGKGARLFLDDGVRIEDGAAIAVVPGDGRAASFKIGKLSRLQSRSRINVTVSVEIGEDCGIGWDVDIIDGDFHCLRHADGSLAPKSRPIVIGDRCWIGMGAKILKGTQIGHDSVVAAGSVVSGTFPPFSLIGGVPAKRLKTIGGWQRRPGDEPVMLPDPSLY